MNYRKKIVKAGKKLYKLGLVAGTSGNVSIKENDDSFYITPSGLSYEDMKEEDIVQIHQDGSPYKSGQKPSSEWNLHIEIYKKYPKYKAVVHTHSNYATAFAVSRVDIPLVLIEMEPFIGGDIKVAPYRKNGSKELAEVTVPYLKNRNSCLLANHGAISCGPDLESAFISAEYVEDAAKIYFKSRLIGNPFIIEE